MDNANADDAVAVEVRPDGLNQIDCAFCGEHPILGGYQPDVAMFVDSRADGLRLVAAAQRRGLHPVLDYRPTEPTWVQVKWGACEFHLPLLRRFAADAAAAGLIDGDALDAITARFCNYEVPA